ncbi:hypothetical protein RchiOBHm_Chr6g0279651 [Rosa chinensis]|uniref:Uncharacterized protein n=1 Tax=Rosa chinensis TaxID=74649 RepID=A0A2P6PT17_ROSCH|nr:hypothetical protein RchiOBHm_Chr6g0279651 [Rosa chinensis]
MAMLSFTLFRLILAMGNCMLVIGIHMAALHHMACLSLAFTWQLYTIWLLVRLHESDSGTR